MTYRLSNRDEHGFLIGSFDQPKGAFPINVVRDIPAFMYPCRDCKAMTFHVVGLQKAGMALLNPFTGKPLVSTSQGYTAICNDCTEINTELPEAVVRKLEQRIIPQQILAMYAQVLGVDAIKPYTDGYAEHLLKGCTASPQATRDRYRKVLELYRREV
jgi:hypothetical protein